LCNEIEEETVESLQLVQENAAKHADWLTNIPNSNSYISLVQLLHEPLTSNSQFTRLLSQQAPKTAEKQSKPNNIFCAQTPQVAINYGKVTSNIKLSNTRITSGYDLIVSYKKCYRKTLIWTDKTLYRFWRFICQQNMDLKTERAL
jgi:hypothetical protein